MSDRGLTLADCINSGLDQILADDPTSLIMGEDVGRLGGVFRITRDLQERHGADRVVDMPLAEAGLVGSAVGLALNGYRPIVEIQFDGFIYPALNQICCHVAKYAARLDYREELPVIIRVPVGGRIGAAEFHSESPETYFAHTPDLRLVAASTADTATALLRAIHASRRPTVFLEPKRLYRRGRIAADARLPRADPSRARVLKPGSAATVVTYGPCVPDALEAAASFADVGVVDLVSLAPIDTETLLSEVGRSGRVVVVTEAVRRCSIASDVVALIAEHAFDRLLAAPRIVSAPDAPPPPPTREDAYFPNAGSIAAAIREALDG